MVDLTRFGRLSTLASPRPRRARQDRAQTEVGCVSLLRRIGYPANRVYEGTALWRSVHYWTQDFWNGPTFNWSDEQHAGFHLTHNNNVHGHFV
jgi:hypothetical protein